MSDMLDSIDELDDDFELDDEVFSGEVVASDDEDADPADAAEMSEVEAREVTEAIRSAATATYALLVHAHQGKAYKAMGYNTWADYVKQEFDISASTAYRLVNLGNVTAEIEAVVPEGTVVKLTEAQARDIKRELPKITEQISEATRDKTPEEAAEEVNRAVEEIREQKKLEDKAANKKQEDDDEAAAAEYQRSLEEAANALLEENGGLGDEGTLDADRAEGLTGSADDGLLDVAVHGDDTGRGDDAVNLFNFFNILETVENLPEPDDFIETIPASRAAEVNQKLLEAAQWFNRAQTLWEAREGL